MRWAAGGSEFSQSLSKQLYFIRNAAQIDSIFLRADLDNCKVISILLPICTGWKREDMGQSIPDCSSMPAPAAPIAHKPGASIHPSHLHTSKGYLPNLLFSPPNYMRVFLFFFFCSDFSAFLSAPGFLSQAFHYKLRIDSLCCKPQ